MADETPSAIDRFETLLAAMLAGEAPSARKKPSADQASDAASDACCDDTRTPSDTSEDAFQATAERLCKWMRVGRVG